MTSCIVFNHHSLPFAAVTDADAALSDFLRVCIRSQNVGLAAVLVDESIDSDWFRLELAPDYFWQDWYGQNKHDDDKKDLIRAFRSIVTRQPFFSMEDLDEGADLFEVSFDGDSSFSALCAAAWHEAPLVSMPTRSPWLSSPLQVEVATLDNEGELTKYQQGILNFFSLENFEREVEQLRYQRNASLRSGREILTERETYFPNLTFCGSAIGQLNDWAAGPKILHQVKESLTCLNTFCEELRDGTYDCYTAEALRELGLNHRVSGESETVMNKPQLRKKREFWLPEGRKKVFENHVKLSSGYRLHFYPENEAQHIYVGHIGPHLRLK
ncbi:MAG: hypothetical protein U9R66_13035 [Thermodesulfobacteriota bacterium]|nr:hypothetical protein [Thermodesulfobacteriota bacterium]